MKNLVRRLLKFLAYTGAAFVILLAVAVGLFRLLLPKLPEYQDELKVWAGDAIGMRVEFSGMDARWGLSGPELNFYDAELIRPTNNTRLLAAEEVSVGVALLRLLRERTVTIDRVLVRETAIEVRERADGRWWVQGTTVDELLSLNQGRQAPGGSIEVVGEDVRLQLLRIGDQRPTTVDVSRINVSRDAQRIAIDSVVRLPDSLGRQLEIGATQLAAEGDGSGVWDISINGRDLVLTGLTALVDDVITPVADGVLDVDLSLRFDVDHVDEAVASFEFANLRAVGSEDRPTDGSGRLEYRYTEGGWLVALDDFMLKSRHGSWPRSSLRLEISKNDDDAVSSLDLRADYLNVADFEIALPWLDERSRQLAIDYAPEGIFRELNIRVDGVDAESPDFAVSAAIENGGVDAVGSLPGVRNLSGKIRADRSGGLADIDSVDVMLLLPEYLSVPVPLDDVYGTLIWRQGANRITLLSDSIVLRNADMSTNSNIELVLLPDSAPEIDLSATFSVTDIAAVKRYIPDEFLKPKLYQWFQDALLGGQLQRGRAVLRGPLDAFPFDNGEGRFLLEANVREARFKYLPKWPEAVLGDVDAVLDGARLYTTRNRSTTVGNRIVDAKVEIADLRQPVLTIEGLATGTLESMRQYASDSPLSQFFAGQLDVIGVDGPASLALDLEVPLKRARDFAVTARVESQGGSVELPGLKRPITDVTGFVTVERDTISSEALAGTFAGQPVSFDLMPAPPELSGFGLVLNAVGTITEEGVVGGFGLPIGEFMSGESEFTASILFPRAGQGQPGQVLTIEASSDLIGFAIELPEPFAKTAEEPLPFAGQIAVGSGGLSIASSGGIDDDLRWQLSFERDDNGVWDLDRGVLSLGDAPPPPAETRGLHVRGRASDIVLEDWLALGDRETYRGGGNDNVLSRLRSIDLEVTNLRLLGQHLVDHRLRLDRSARDWLVQFEGADIDGSVFVPYDLLGERPVVLDMERLVLPGDPTAIPDDGPSTDPRSLPALSVRAREFAIGDRFFGALEADILRTGEGLESSKIVAVDDSFEIVATGSWLANEDDPRGSRTTVTATLTSTDVQTTLGRLGYSPGLVGNDMSAILDLDWSGGPGDDFLPTLDGEVELRMGAGQLNEVEPGAGRVLGLMSIVALPRRLSLDFTDVFEKGFGFDKIEGSFRLDDGETYTCNLSLEAPAADIAIIGRASLVNRDYEQTALIGANVGNVLPVAAAAAAGPQAAVAVLIFSQIFKKPLQEMGQVYYSIEGPWDDPVIEQADTERFASTSELANCVTEAEPNGE